MKSSSKGRLVSALLACALAVSAPAAYAAEAGLDTYSDGDFYTMDNTYYWGDDFYYRDNYTWHADFARDIARLGLSYYYTSPNVDRDGYLNREQALRQVGLAANSSQGSMAVVRVVNGEVIAQRTLRDLASEAKRIGRTAVICADTLMPGYDTHQTRMFFEPDQMTWSDREVRLGVYSDNEWIYEAKQGYLEIFRNHIELIRFAQPDEFPAIVQVYALIDLSKLDKSKLMFYSCNRRTGVVTQITDPQYSFTSNNKLMFYTQYAGDILITDRQLIERVDSLGWISAERIAAEEEAERIAAEEAAAAAAAAKKKR